MSTPVPRDSDRVIEVQAKDEVDDSFINDATVTVTGVLQKGGKPVTWGGFPLPLSYVGGSNGLYRGTLPFDLPLQPLQTYTVLGFVDAGSGRRRRFRLDVFID